MNHLMREPVGWLRQGWEVPILESGLGVNEAQRPEEMEVKEVETH